MQIEVYVADDGEVLYQRYPGDPKCVDRSMLESGAKFWQSSIHPSEEDRYLRRYLPGVKRFYRMRLTLTACGETREDAAFDRRAAKVLERLIEPREAMRRGAMADEVYLVSEGSYSDYSIRGVFSTEANAHEFIERACPEGQIEPYLLDNWLPQLREGLVPWKIQMYLDGSIAVCERCEINQYWGGLSHYLSRCRDPLTFGGLKARNDSVFGYVMARDEEHAVKIMNDRRTQFLAMQNSG